MRGASFVLPKAGIYAEALLPDLGSALAIRLDGAHAPVDSVNYNLRVRMCAQVVVPGRMAVLAEIGGDDRYAALRGDAENWDGTRLTAFRAGRGQHHHRNTRQETGECVPSARESVNRAIDVMQHPGE